MTASAFMVAGAQVHWPTSRAQAWIERLPQDVPELEAIVVIGSAARHALRERSDIDLIVVYRGDRPRVRPPPEVDIRWIEVERLDFYVRQGDDVVAWGVKYGVALFDPHQIWQGLVDCWHDRVPRPTPQLCRQRAAKARGYAAALVDARDLEAASEQVLTMLTHLARGAIAARGEYPASRSELAHQLRGLGDHGLADLLERALRGILDPSHALQTSTADTDLDVNTAPSRGVGA